MDIPEDAAKFVESVRNATQKLIERGFWDVKLSRLESWWGQFCGDEEKYFAACILDQTIFRNAHQFEAGLKALYRSNLRGAMYQDSTDLKLATMLASGQDRSLKLVPVICDTDPPTKSGPFVLRRLQRVLGVKNWMMCWPWQAREKIAENGVNSIIFVDDFLGSGEQFKKFYKQWELDEIAQDVDLIYAPIVAHQSGISFLRTEFPKLKVVSAETLGEADNFFSEEVWQLLGRGLIAANDALEWYQEFAKSKDIVPKNGSEIGYGGLGLTFAFSHATPNNSLPILWYESTVWNPLLER